MDITGASGRFAAACSIPALFGRGIALSRQAVGDRCGAVTPYLDAT